MDRAKLERKLHLDFKNGCLNKGYPLVDICLEEAYPGDSSTSFIVNIIADWVKDMDCSNALDILIDILWDTTEFEYREAIFAINIFSDTSTLHCRSIENVNEYLNSSESNLV
jgi:hypothetical protein